MNDNQPWEFTCNTCGGHKLTVTHVWSILAGPVSERWQEWGPLEADHHWHYEFKERVEENPDDEVERGDFGEFAEDDSASEPEEYEIFEPENNPESDEFYVNCADCDREIEFGWSQPDRDGRIFPVECSDFIPGESWPEPRYLDSWQQKGWLQTEDEQPMIKPENKNAVEMHGCIVCARIFNILAVYTPDGRLLDCAVTSSGGHCVPDERRPLVACDTHTAGEIEAAYKRWQSRNDKESDNEQEDE